MSDNNDDLPTNGDDLSQKLNFETGRLSWPELQRHFARGIVIVVSSELDLIEVAVKLKEDDKQLFESWLSQNQVWRANDHDALQWQESGPEFWSVVVAPWVLVQVVKN
ncbi:MAG: DUF2288 domain-containing protein [Gammaproteobacteria bacterium]|nr:DUF2288 domain-containing protein [Gammaproteobacteria bacterium]